MQYNRIFI